MVNQDFINQSRSRFLEWLLSYIHNTGDLTTDELIEAIFLIESNDFLAIYKVLEQLSNFIEKFYVLTQTCVQMFELE